MVDHEPATVGTSILVGKLIVVGRHVHYVHLDDKR
jgi:hypothetical protein